MNAFPTHPSVRLLLLVGFLFSFSLFPLGCDWLEGEVASSVKQDTGVDINSPQQVAAAAAVGSVLGNQDQNDALTVLRGYRRAQHEQKGDSYWLGESALGEGGQLPLARDEYRKALQWTDTDSSAGKGKAANLHGRIGNTYAYEVTKLQEAAGRINNPEAKADLLQASKGKSRLAAEEYGRAANLEPDAAARARILADQAKYYKLAGD